LFVAILAASAVACSKGGTPSEQTTPPEQTKKEGPFVIGVDIYYAQNTWSVQSAEETKAAVRRNADRIKEVYYTDSEGKAEKQVANIEDLIAKKVDAIILSPISPTAAAPVIEKAVAQGIVVVINGTAVETDKYTAAVDVDDKAFGTVLAEWLVEKLGGKGNIIALNGIPGISTSELRWEGAKEVFDKYPDIKIVGMASADWDYAKGKTATANLLAANPQIDGVWSQGGEMTRGAIEAFQAAGRPLVPMTGEDNNGFLKVWKQLRDSGSSFDSIGASKPTWLGALAVETALDILEGKPYQKLNRLPVPTITSENLDEYVRPDMPDALWANTKLTDDEIRALFK